MQNEQTSEGFILLDENRLKKNPIFDSWMEYEHQHRHERSLIIKGSTNNILDIAGCDKEKFAQGPFLEILAKKAKRRYNGSLRSELDYFSFQKHAKNVKQMEKLARISEKPFSFKNSTVKSEYVTLPKIRT
jgi:hypothetical protein